MVWNQEEIDAFKARRAQGEGNLGKVDDFVNVDSSSANVYHQSPTQRSPVRKWTSTTTSPAAKIHGDWLGSTPSPTKKSWKVKSTKPNLPSIP